MKPYSVSATNLMGTVEMMTPAMGMKPQMNTNRESRPSPGIASAHMPRAVRIVFTTAMRDCRGKGRCEGSENADRAVRMVFTTAMCDCRCEEAEA